MSDQQISDALDDIRLEVSRGNRDPNLIDEIAREYGLRPEALRARLSKAYGTLDELASRQAKSAESAAIEANMGKAIFEYADGVSTAGVNIADWLEERAGRAPSEGDIEYAKQLWMQRTLSKLMAGSL